MNNIINQLWQGASILRKITLAAIIIGFLSILIAGVSSDVYLSKGDGFTDTKAWIDGPLAEGYAPVTGDFDGDKRCDLCTISRDGLFTVYLSSGELIASGDFNGDKASDLVVISLNKYRGIQFHQGVFSGLQRLVPASLSLVRWTKGVDWTLCIVYIPHTHALLFV